MTVDFPEPDGPTIAVVYPGSKVQLKVLSTFNSGLVGYLKSMSLNSILPAPIWKVSPTFALTTGL